MERTSARTHSFEQPAQGQQFGQYTLIGQIGRGGYATVYQGQHIYLQTKVAIKLLNLSLTNHEEIKRFQFEARLLANLRHHNILRILDFGWEKGTPFLVTEYAPGGTLQCAFSQKVPQRLDALLPIVSQIASGLQYIHNHHLIHCDIKPENLLLSSLNEIWLSDFGIATLTDQKEWSETQEFRGTPRYLAPEYIYGEPQPASDQYALAVLAYKWLCGQWPFSGTDVQICSQQLYTLPPPLREHVPSISRQIERVVLKALSKAPEQRFANVTEFARALMHTTGFRRTTRIRRVLDIPVCLDCQEEHSSYETTHSTHASGI